MTSSVDNSMIPLLLPQLEIRERDSITYKSIKLTFSLSLGFQAYVMCGSAHSSSLTSKGSLVPALVETRFHVPDLKEKILKMAAANHESHFLNIFNVEVQRTSNQGFKVVLSEKSSKSDPLPFYTPKTMAISSDGTRFLSVYPDKTIRLYELATGKELVSLKGHQEEVLSVQFTHEGKMALSSSKDNTFRFWDLQKGEECLCVKVGKTQNPNVDFAQIPEFKERESSVPRAVHIPVLPPFPKIKLNSGLFEEDCSIENVNVLAISQDGKWVLSANSDKIIHLWNSCSGQKIHTLRMHIDQVNCVAFSPDSKWALTGSHDRTIKLWDLQVKEECCEQEKHCFEGHERAVTCVGFSPDGKKAISGSRDNTVRLWDLESGKQLLCLKAHLSYITSVEFSPNGQLILSGSEDKTVRIWDSETGQERYCFQQNSAIQSAKFLPDGRNLLIASHQPIVQLCHLFNEKGDLNLILKWSTDKNGVKTKVADLSGNLSDLTLVAGSNSDAIDPIPFKNHFEGYNSILRFPLPRPTNTVSIKDLVQIQLSACSDKNVSSPSSEKALGTLKYLVQNPHFQRDLRQALSLAYSQDPFVSLKLLKLIQKKINIQPYFDMAMFDAFCLVIRTSPPEALNPEGLKEFLKSIISMLSVVLKQENRDLRTLLNAFIGLFDCLGDLNLLKLDSKVYELLFLRLNELITSDDLSIAWVAEYTKQSLKRVIDSEPTLFTYLNRELVFQNGDVNDFTGLLNFFRFFNTASQAEGKWVDKFRVMKFLLDKERFDDFEHFTYLTLEESTSPYLAAGIIELMNEVYSTCLPLHIMKSALSILGDIFLNDQKWASEKRIKLAVLNSLLKHAQKGNSMKDWRRAVHQCLEKISSKANEQQKELISLVFPADVSSIPLIYPELDYSPLPLFSPFTLSEKQDQDDKKS